MFWGVCFYVNKQSLIEILNPNNYEKKRYFDVNTFIFFLMKIDEDGVKIKTNENN